MSTGHTEYWFPGVFLSIIPKIIALGLMIITSACTAPPDSSSKEKAPQLKEAKGAGLSFIYNPMDFKMVEMRKEQKQTMLEIGVGVDEGFAPEHVCFDLKDKRPLHAIEQGPRYFFPAHSFVCAMPLEDSSVEDFGEAYPSLDAAARDLEEILRERPEKFKSRREIPDIPDNNASPSILSRFQYLDFRSGSGILFLTQYSQEIEPNPLNNEELTFVFQGITEDRRHYVAARLAITHSSLPAGIDSTDHIVRDSDYSYLRIGETELEGLPEDSFQPSLGDLKDLVSSIHVE